MKLNLQFCAGFSWKKYFRNYTLFYEIQIDLQ